MNVEWAQACSRPSCIPQSRPRGVKAQGLRYERLLAKAWPEAIHGQWWAYGACGARKFCQTDLLLAGSKGAWIVEVKLSWTPEARRSLDEVYIPVVACALQRPAWGLMATQHLRKGMSGVVLGDLDEALEAAKRGWNVIWHWLPGTPLRAQRAA